MTAPSDGGLDVGAFLVHTHLIAFQKAKICYFFAKPKNVKITLPDLVGGI